MAPRTQFILQDVTINTENVAGAWRHKVRAPDLLNLQGYLSRDSPDGLQFGCNDFPIWRFWRGRAAAESAASAEQRGLAAAKCLRANFWNFLKFDAKAALGQPAA